MSDDTPRHLKGAFIMEPGLALDLKRRHPAPAPLAGLTSCDAVGDFGCTEPTCQQCHGPPPPSEITRLRSLVAAHERRIAELTKANGALIHERDRLAAQVGEAVRVSRREPAITLFCDSPECTTPALTRDVAPPEDAIPLWVRGMGWECTEGGYLCPGCSRGR